MSSIKSLEKDLTGLDEGHEEPQGETQVNFNQSMGLDELRVDAKASTVMISQDFDIEFDSPAAKAIRAVSGTKVSNVGKAKSFFNKSIEKTIKREKICKSFIDPSANILSHSPADNEEEEIKEKVKESGITTRAAKSVRYDLSGSNNNNEYQRSPSEILLRDKDGKRKGISFLSKAKSFRTTTKKKNKNVKGKIIDRENELYALSIAMMLGLRSAIYNTNIELQTGQDTEKKWLKCEEFMHAEKYVFRPDGSHNTPPHKLGHTFKFKDYSPVPFAYIRRMFGINEYEFIDSICADANFIEFISNSKSGQFFFYSSDGKYMIKTMSTTESKFLRRSKFTFVIFIWPVLNHSSYLNSSQLPPFFYSFTTLLSTLCSKSKHSHDKISWHVSCQTFAAPAQCYFCYNEFCV